MSAAHELALYLATEGVGAFGGSGDWGLHVSREPFAPDNVITLYDTGGGPAPNYNLQLREPTIQVRTRSISYASGFAKQESIFALLNAIKTQQISGRSYIGVWIIGEILSIGRDDNDRHLLTANYRIQRGT